MIKMDPNLFYELRHALIESRDTNLAIAEKIQAECTGIPGYARMCIPCHNSSAAHLDCANKASNFLARMEADQQRTDAGMEKPPATLYGEDYDRVRAKLREFGGDENNHSHIIRAVNLVQDERLGIAEKSRPRRPSPADDELDNALNRLHDTALGAKPADPSKFRSHAGTDFAGSQYRRSTQAEETVGRGDGFRPRDNIILDVEIQDKISGGSRLILDDHTIYQLRNAIFTDEGK